MLVALLLSIFLWFKPVLAASLVLITIPASATVQQSSLIPVSGFSITDSSGTTITVSVTSATGVLYASPSTSGAQISGQTTGTLTIVGTLAQVNAALATLEYFTIQTSGSIGISATDAGGGSGILRTLTLTVASDSNTYLIEANPTAALTRSQQQCAAVNCDGVQTKYWWTVINLSDGTAAIQLQPFGAYGVSATAVVKGVPQMGSLTPAELTARVQASAVTAYPLPIALP